MLKDRMIERKNNFMTKSHAEELEQNNEIVIINKRDNNSVIELILEPNKFNQLSTECRLTVEEFVDAIDEFITNEEDDWSELRMKDIIECSRDMIIKKTVLKFAKEHYKIDEKNYDGNSISYTPRFNEENELIGDQIVVSLTKL